MKINTSVMLSEIEASFARDLSTSLKVTIFKLLDYIIDDVLTTGETLAGRIDKLKEIADITVAAVIVIVNRKGQTAGSGEERIRQKHDAEVYSIVTYEDIEKFFSRI